MPRLKAFGYCWNIGSDDILIPSSIEAFLKSAGMVSLIYYYLKHRNEHFDTECGDMLKMFYQSGLVLMSLDIGLLVAICRCSLQGTLVNCYPRRNMTRLIAYKGLLSIPALFVSVFGTKLVYYSDYTCSPEIQRYLINAVKFSWPATFAGLIGLWFILNPIKGKADLIHDQELRDTWLSTARRSFVDRFHKMSQILGIDTHPGINDLAEMLTQFFQEDVDIVPSDIMVALLLLHREQETVQKSFQELKSSPEVHQSQMKMKTWMSIQNASHYMKYANSSYGLAMQLLQNPFKGIVMLSKGRLFGKCPECVVGDNAFLINTGIIKYLTGLSDENLVYVTFHNRLFEIPFFVALDHKKRSIVVSIRGSVSLEDWLVDLTAFASETIPVEGQEGLCHEGMYRCAQYIYNKLTGSEEAEENILTCKRREKPLLELAQEQLESLVGPDVAQTYDLVVVGHSLGAGTAAPLALLLHNNPKYSHVKCFAFSPPGGLFDEKTAAYCEDFILSVVVGDDIVTRLSLVSAYNLKIRLFQLIRDCDVPKHKLFDSWVDRFMSRLVGRKSQGEVHYVNHSWAGCREAEHTVEKFQLNLQSAIDNSLVEKKLLPKLYMPGLVLYVQPFVQRLSFWKSTISYESFVSNGRSPVFNEVLLSSDIIKNHTPWYVVDVLKALSMEDC